MFALLAHLLALLLAHLLAHFVCAFVGAFVGALVGANFGADFGRARVEHWLQFSAGGDQNVGYTFGSVAAWMLNLEVPRNTRGQIQHLREKCCRMVSCSSQSELCDTILFPRNCGCSK